MPVLNGYQATKLIRETEHTHNLHSNSIKEEDESQLLSPTKLSLATEIVGLTAHNDPQIDK